MKNNKYLLVVDTNIFIKAYFQGNISCVNVLKHLENKDNFQLAFNQDTIGELVYNLKNFCNNKPKWLQDQIYEFISSIIKEGIIVNTLDTQYYKCLDDNDNMFIATAIKSNADYIISEDYNSGIHNTMFQQLNNIKVLNAKNFCKYVQDVSSNKEVS